MTDNAKYRRLRETYTKALEDMEGEACGYVLLDVREIKTTIEVIDTAIAATIPNMFFECGGCGAYHPLGFKDDCRDNANRFNEIPDTAIVVDEGESI